MTRIYTRTGDKGQTGLADGRRLRKSHRRITALGEVDELNAQLGVVLACGVDPMVREVLEALQHRLFDLGAVLAGSGTVTRFDAGWVETQIDRFEARLTPLRSFILPGGAPAAAHCQLARAVCRRAERAVVALACQEPVPPAALRFLNRLSDLLFVLARWINRTQRVPEVPWRTRDEA